MAHLRSGRGTWPTSRLSSVIADCLLLQRKFNVPVTTLLLESGFISVSEYDAQLAKFIMREFRPTVVNFAAQLARECLLTERPIASREHFSHSLRALAQAVQSGKGGDL